MFVGNDWNAIRTLLNIASAIWLYFEMGRGLRNCLDWKNVIEQNSMKVYWLLWSFLVIIVLMSVYILN